MKIDNIAKILVVSATAAAFYAPSSAAASLAEIEINDTFTEAHALGRAKSHSVKGAMGTVGARTYHNDVDFYTFDANEGDVLTIDIDNGYGGEGSIDTIVGIFDESGTLLRMNNDMNDDNEAIVTPDEGSTSLLDSMIEAFTVPATGTYTVGVSTYPRFFALDGSLMNVVEGRRMLHGDYTLEISGITMAVKQINFEVKPGSKKMAPLNPTAKGKIPVAIYGAPDFDVSTIKQESLTFGSTGKEKSLSHCQPVSRDINKDGHGDLLCHFDNSAAGFKSGDIEVRLKGETKAKQAFEGQAVLKVLPSKRK